MPYDANLVLRGPYGDNGAYTNVIVNDVVPITLAGTTAVNGNHVVDLGPHGTGAKGVDIVVIFHDTFTDEEPTLDVQVCDSDHIDGGWELNQEFPRLYPCTREIIGVATVAWTAIADIGNFAVDLVNTTAGGMLGHIIAFSRELLVIGGVGKIWIAMQGVGDTYPNNGNVLTSDGGGAVTQIGASRLIQQNGFTMVRRLSTPRRYIRPTFIALDEGGTADFGHVDMLVTGSQHNHVNNLYR